MVESKARAVPSPYGRQRTGARVRVGSAGRAIQIGTRGWCVAPAAGAGLPPRRRLLDRTQCRGSDVPLAPADDVGARAAFLTNHR